MAIGIGTIIGASAISGLGSLAGGLLGANAAKSAARLQAAATAQRRADLQPFTQAGLGGLNELQLLLGLKGTPEEQRGALQETPGFQFQLEQGVNALDRSAVSRGGLLSGNQVKAQTQFGQGLANQSFNTRANQLFSLAGLGQTSAAGQGVASQLGAQGQGNALIAGSQALAGGIGGVSNAITSGISNLIFSNFLTEQAKNG